MVEVTTETAPAPPASLLDRLRADPVRAPELLALAAAERHGPAAMEWFTGQRARHPEKLARKAKRAHARLARFGGAATGVGGWTTIVPDLAALGWIQSRMVFYIAAAYGFDPRDPMRPAELLVLWGLYDDPVEARTALDGAGRTIAEATARKATRGSEDALLTRLASAAARHGGRHMAGRFIPGAAIFFNAIGNERATRELADRARRFYGG
jgi:hypothetical protein